MKHINDIFDSLYPKLDIHGETYDLADLIIKEFIEDNIKLGKEKVLIIHGKGNGILKKKTHEILSKHPKVIDYSLRFNLGSTIVTLNIDK